MKSKNKKQKQRMTRKIYNIVVPYALETTTQRYKEITTDYQNSINTLHVDDNNAYTVDNTGALPKITLTTASSELKTLSGNGNLTSFDLTYTPNNLSKVKVKIGGVLQDSNTYNIVKNFILFTICFPYILFVSKN